MTDDAAVKPTTRISKVWVIPIIALLIGAWMVYYQWQNQGPLITIDMSSASGIEVNKTPIKIRDLDVGQVKRIELKPELDGVTVTARLEKSAARLLNESTRFWVVAPRVSFSEVSGLNTLLSGSFIAMTAEAGQTEQDHFTDQNHFHRPGSSSTDHNHFIGQIHLFLIRFIPPIIFIIY